MLVPLHPMQLTFTYSLQHTLKELLWNPSGEEDCSIFVLNQISQGFPGGSEGWLLPSLGGYGRQRSWVPFLQMQLILALTNCYRPCQGCWPVPCQTSKCPCWHDPAWGHALCTNAIASLYQICTSIGQLHERIRQVANG